MGRPDPDDSITTSHSPASTTQAQLEDGSNSRIVDHPPSHAGAVQTYHFAMIVLLIHMPSIGGVDAYRTRQRQLDDSFRVICGIASHNFEQGPLAFVNIQALYAGK